MKSSFGSSKILDSEKGQVTMGLIAVVVITGAIYAIIHFKDKFASEGQSRIDSIKVPVNVRSGIETMIAALRQAEIEYIKHVSMTIGCVSANTFIDALVNGTNCVGPTGHAPFSVFIDGAAPGVIDKLYHYANSSPCTIGKTFGCITPTVHPEVVRIGVPGLFGIPSSSEAIGGLQFWFSLVKVDTTKKSLTMKAVVRKPDKAKKIFEIEFRDSNVNMAHMDADGKLRQSNPNPNDLCKDPNPALRGPFSELQVFDDITNTCRRFAQMGGGTGLNYYKGRYFSFRPSDGQVFDLLEASNSLSPYFAVSETGYIGTTKVFPEYKKDILQNAEDLTVIEDQIYYVKGQILDASIYALVDPTNLINHSVKVCELGSLGWAQSYVGLASKAWSDVLVPSPPNTSPKIATFFLKTFSGDLLTAVIWPNGLGSFTCTVLKDSASQVEENKRTYGFDKIVSDRSFGYW